MTTGPPEKELVTFVKKITRQGKYYSIFIPKDYVDAGLVDPAGIYQVWLKRVGTREEGKDD